MRRLDEVKDKRIRNVKEIKILDKKRIQIIFNNNEEIILCATSEDYGYDAGIYFEKDSI